MGWRNAELWVNLFLVLLSAAVIREAFELEVGTPQSPGSGFMFFGAATILGLLALHRFVRSLVTNPVTEGTSGGPIHRGRIVAVIGANLLYILLFEILGYLVSTFLFLSFLFQVLERGRWVRRFGGAALVSVFTYLFFARLLQLNLPRGVLSFF